MAALWCGFFVILTLEKEKPAPDISGNGLSFSEVLKKCSNALM
jgi:hypothetical protein